MLARIKLLLCNFTWKTSCTYVSMCGIPRVVYRTIYVVVHNTRLNERSVVFIPLTGIDPLRQACIEFFLFIRVYTQTGGKEKKGGKKGEDHVERSWSRRHMRKPRAKDSMYSVHTVLCTTQNVIHFLRFSHVYASLCAQCRDRHAFHWCSPPLVLFS